MAAQLIGSDIPFFITSILCLVVIYEVEQFEGRPDLGSFFEGSIGAFLVVSILFQSVGTGLLLGLMMWMLAKVVVKRKAALPEIRYLVPVALFSGLVFLSWVAYIQRAKLNIVDQIRSSGTYVDQFWLADHPRRPELGQFATVDMVRRMARNLVIQSAYISARLMRPAWVEPHVTSPLVFVPLVLTFLRR